MHHDLFEWDFENIQHIARHGVTPEEAEEALSGSVMGLEHQDWHEELRIVQVGATWSGRILQITTTDRGFRLRVVTAYDPVRSVIRRYYAEMGGA